MDIEVNKMKRYIVLILSLIFSMAAYAHSKKVEFSFDNMMSEPVLISCANSRDERHLLGYLDYNDFYSTKISGQKTHCDMTDKTLEDDGHDGRFEEISFKLKKTPNHVNHVTIIAYGPRSFYLYGDASGRSVKKHNIGTGRPSA